MTMIFAFRGSSDLTSQITWYQKQNCLISVVNCLYTIKHYSTLSSKQTTIMAFFAAEQSR